MRRLQVGLFIVSVVALLAALVVAGRDLGDILWRVGVALLLTDLVAMRLWPTPRPPGGI